MPRMIFKTLWRVTLAGYKPVDVLAVKPENAIVEVRKLMEAGAVEPEDFGGHSTMIGKMDSVYAISHGPIADAEDFVGGEE